ncbi:MAG: HEAT repeat domain-containing protein [Bacteroidota bacterium]
MPELNSLLADLLSGDESRGEAAVPGLAALGEEARAALLEAADSESADQRWWAVRALAEAAPGELIQFLKDPAPEVRQAAALGLGASADGRSVPALIEALYDEDSMVGSLASNALVKAGQEAVPALLEVLKSAPQAVRIHALRALIELKDHRAIPAMLQMAGEDSAVISHWAQVGLERLGLNMIYIKPT